MHARGGCVWIPLNVLGPLHAGCLLQFYHLFCTSCSLLCSTMQLQGAEVEPEDQSVLSSSTSQKTVRLLDSWDPSDPLQCLWKCTGAAHVQLFHYSPTLGRSQGSCWDVKVPTWLHIRGPPHPRLATSITHHVHHAPRAAGLCRSPWDKQGAQQLATWN